MPLLLVRHARALSRSTWEGDDDFQRPLSPEGRLQAKLLAGVLAAFDPTRILSSPALRCLETVGPLAAEVGVDVTPEKSLAEGSTGAVKLVRSMAGENAALCSHGDIIPMVLETLAAEDRLHLGKHPKVEKASVWVLEPGSKRFHSARYIAPPKV